MKNEDIPTREIFQDIADTETEIAQMTIEAKHLEQTPCSMSMAKWDHMRAQARRSGIAERQEFIRKLRAILESREATAEGA